MIELDIEESKKIELEILQHLDKFCKSNGLQYYLAYGTLIGAVRHKGFIPWDDDIDLMMSREHYNWLIENYNKLNPDGRYKLISPYDKGAKHTFVKFIDTYTVKIESGIAYNEEPLGIDVDIFPIDGQPDSQEEFEKWFDKLRHIYILFGYCLLDRKKNFKRNVMVPIIRLVTGGCKKLLKKADKLHKLYSYDESKYVGVTECLYINKGDRYNKECISTAIDAEFEGMQFPIPVGYDEILTNIYGNYMKLPPIEKQVTHHANKMYLKSDCELK